jgi:hypothetical protein
MAQQYNAIIAQQLVNFRGISTVGVGGASSTIPNFRAISGSRYAVRVYNGTSGTFGVHVRGRVGGSTATYILAGFTATSMAGVGNYILYPAGNRSFSRHCPTRPDYPSF